MIDCETSTELTWYIGRLYNSVIDDHHQPQSPLEFVGQHGEDTRELHVYCWKARYVIPFERQIQYANRRVDAGMAVRFPLYLNALEC